MKKKIKIFSTIASLCLAVALMAFGVYAATQITLTTTSTIKFAATEIQGYWSLQVVGGDHTAYNTLTKIDSTEATAEDNRVPVGDTVAIDPINLTVQEDGTATVVYTVVFTQKGEKGATVTVTPTLEAVTGFDVDVKTAQTKTTAAKDATCEFVFTVTLDTKTPGFDSGSSCEADFDLVCQAVPTKA